MMRPMMVMTTSISTSVKPRWPRIRERRRLAEPICVSECFILEPVVCHPTTSSDDLGDGEQGGHDGNNETADDDADGNDGKRADDANYPVEAALEFRLVKLFDAGRKRRHLAGFLADTEHAYSHRRQDSGRRKRVRYLAAVAHAISGRHPVRNSSGDRHDVHKYPQRRGKGNIAA